MIEDHGDTLLPEFGGRLRRACRVPACVVCEMSRINRLRAHGVRYVIVHRQLYEPERLENLMLRISSRPELKPWGAYQDPLGMADLFELLD